MGITRKLPLDRERGAKGKRKESNPLCLSRRGCAGDGGLGCVDVVGGKVIFTTQTRPPPPLLLPPRSVVCEETTNKHGPGFPVEIKTTTTTTVASLQEECQTIVPLQTENYSHTTAAAAVESCAYIE